MVPCLVLEILHVADSVFEGCIYGFPVLEAIL